VSIDLIALEQGVSEAHIDKSEVDDARLRIAVQYPSPLVKVLRGHRMGDTQSLFDEFDAVFQLPSYFGKNWSALDECMNDGDWFPVASRVIVVVVDSEQVLSLDTDRGAAKTTLQSFFRRLVENWGSGTNGRQVNVSVLLQR
jgi:RNAse (barnase) inhibitor barstar